MIAHEPREIAERIVQAAEPYEFRTFLVGLQRPPEAERAACEKAHRRIKSAVGQELHRRWPDRTVDFRRPEMRFEVRDDLEIRCRPLAFFLAGRYRKLSRAIPASRWVHLACEGRGCAACGYTGNLCGPSIQEVFAGPLLRATGGERCFFHGLGREDTDARMLGDGRPFVLEVQEPRCRSPDLRRLIEDVTEAGRGLCELLAPRVVTGETVRLIKEAGAEKTYRAWIELSGTVPSDARRRAESLAGALIEQLSPKRVMHRRGASKMRPKRVIESRWLGDVDGLAVWEVRAESGTYIKELISGDEGRTRPSLAGALGVPARCVALDVIEIHWEPPWEADASSIDRGAGAGGSVYEARAGVEVAAPSRRAGRDA